MMPNREVEPEAGKHSTLNMSVVLAKNVTNAPQKSDGFGGDISGQVEH